MKTWAIIAGVVMIVSYILLIYAISEADENSRKERNKHERATDD